ncbi:Muramoyltetrapeptide carboxypeptidase [Lentibacillus sp. JNUCC-1]|uniref:S66 peptidase family protein n=1 Tax=Lentibacillus sp. JNUCC-1 TaxID=2654513 RepID=UPI0012E9291E|nr:LD-carboxypeptidase [Lentibacillus sp. JNUCC-1]MUV36761.1 Muramoyltetrapeptide carboxypeptidase [Lentibacillus sp. JNUCC-1]
MANRPPILQPGDTVGIVTLGSPLDAATINARIQILQGMGFQVVVGQHVYDYNGFLAGTDQERAADLMDMFMNDQVKMILPVRGGVGVSGIFPYLDFSVIRRHPKIVSGYSDVTSLLNVLAQFGDLITFHSLLLINFTPYTPAYNYNQFFTATSRTAAPRVIENANGIMQVGKVPGNVTGPLVGGNLTSFMGLLGTPYEIDTTGKILFLEETNEPINTVYRYLNELILAGKFDDCIGIVMGQCTNCPNSYGQNYEELIDQVLTPLGKPLLINVTAGHSYYKAAIPIGAVANLDTVNVRLTVLEPTVSLVEEG